MEKQSLHKYAGRWRVAGPCVAILLGFLASRSLLPIYTDSAPDAKLKSRPHSVGIQPKNLFPEIMKFEKAWFKVLDSETSSEVAGLEVSVVSAHDSIDARAVLVRDGGFELDGGFKEDDSLKVSAPGYFRLVLPFERLSALRQSLFLLPARAITVKAINASSGSPIPGALVTSNRPGREELSIKTDEGGLALLLDVSVNLVQARSGGLLYEVPVIVRAPGFLPTRAAAKPGVEAPVCVVALDPELMLDLIVVDAVTGQGVPNVGVVYQFNHGGLSRTNRFENVQLTGPTGTIQLAVPADVTKLELVADHPDYGFAFGVVVGDELEAAVAGRVGIVLKLEPGYPIEGLVLDQYDQPVLGAIVHLLPLMRDPVNEWMRSAFLRFFRFAPDRAANDGDGFFRFARVPPGEYRIIPAHPDLLSDISSAPVAIAESGAYWVVQVVLHYLDAEGKRVKWYSKTVETRPDGSFAVKGLQEGHYRAIFTAAIGYEGHREEIDATSPPLPWVVVLEDKTHNE